MGDEASAVGEVLADKLVAYDAYHGNVTLEMTVGKSYFRAPYIILCKWRIWDSEMSLVFSLLLKFL